MELMEMAAHDLRSPLNAIKMHIEVLQKKMFSGDQLDVKDLTRIFHSMHRAVDRQAALLDVLLNAAQLHDGHLQLEMKKINFSKLLQEMASDLEPEALVQGSRLWVRVHPNVIGHWDPIRLQQIVYNLVGNAIKYGAGKPVNITLAKDGDAILTVKDQGIGIAHEDLPRVFDRAFRAKNTGVMGLGLGLWITKSLVELHGGRINVTSEVGKGSTFVVRLPYQ